MRYHDGAPEQLYVVVNQETGNVDYTATNLQQARNAAKNIDNSRVYTYQLKYQRESEFAEIGPSGRVRR